jgi:acetolactate synthase I/II/III large subunit
MSDPHVRSAQRVVETLSAYGIKYVFGVPGAKVDAVFDSLLDGGPELIVCRHEQNAAFLASAVGRLTGTPGAVLVTSGPGTTNLVTGMLTATTEQYPMVAVCGAVARADRLKRTHQSMDAVAVVQPVTKSAGEISEPDNVPEALANAIRVATTAPRGATAVVLPADVAESPTGATVLNPTCTPKLGPAPAEQILRAADMIRSAKRPVLLAGLRSSEPDACAALRSLLEATDLPVVETFQAAGVVDRQLEDHFVGRVGLVRNQPGDVLVAHADVIITIGYDPVEYDPRLWNTDPSRVIVHIDELPADMDNHYQPVVELRGGIARTLDGLTDHLWGLRLSPEVASFVAEQRDSLTDIDEHARAAVPEGSALNPAAVVLSLREHLDDDATVACDVGTHYIHMARHFRTYQPRHLLFSNGQQTLGVALPWAMAAALVRPGTQVVSVSGDGGFLFSGQELETATRLGLHFTHIIMRDNAYNMVEFQEQLKYGRTSGIELADYDITHYAAAFGAKGVRVSTMEELHTALERSLTTPGVTIIDVRVDYSHSAELYAQLHDGVLE